MNMASQKFSNFSIDYILGETSIHPSSPRDCPRPPKDPIFQNGAHGNLTAMIMNFPSPSWAGTYGCCAPASYYQAAFNPNYAAGLRWTFVMSGCDKSENHFYQTLAQRQRHRVRTVFTEAQTQKLEMLFARTDYPTLEARAELARSASLSEETVRVWFKNRRARRKRQSTSTEKSAQMKESE